MSTKPTKSQREPQRIAKLLARAGIASRREIERMIAEGRVALNGTALDTPATLLTSLHGITVDGEPVFAPAPARLFIYHKPPGLLVTERDPKGRPTIYDRLPKDLPRVMPVGRLDLNTEGLLLLTTDGELKRQLELPATGVERTYRARTYGPISQAQLEDLIEGIEIEGVRYGSIDANLERRTGANAWIELTLTEGKNREVRRVLEHLGLQVSRLIRTRYGPFILADMPPGDIGEVRQHAVIAFRKNPTAKEVHITAEQRREERAADAEQAAPAPRPGRPGRPAHPGARTAPRTPREGERTPRSDSARPSRFEARPPRPDGKRSERAPRDESARPQRPPARSARPDARSGAKTGDRTPRSDTVRPQRPAGKSARPDARPDTRAGERPARADPGRPQRGKPAPRNADAPREPREGDFVDRPRNPRPPRPRSSKPRPPRTRR